MKIFVSGASGFQGGNIAQQLIAKNHKISTLKRTIGEGVPVREGIDIIEGGLGDKEALNKALQHTNVAVYTFPLLFDMKLAKEYTSNFIAAAKEQKVDLVIFNATFDLPKEETELLALNLKVEMKRLFDASGLNVITLVPDIYIDNLAAPWSIPVILNDNILPYPVTSGTKVPWISHIDLAKYVVSAIDKPELAGQTLPIGGNLFTGEEIAAAISDKIKKPVNFVGVLPDDFEKQLAPAFGELAAREISNLYRYVEQNQTEFLKKDFKNTNKLLSVTPQTLDEWVDSVSWAN
ncbi:SDR family oxidoreductase [Aquimarina algiphila]|uniref:NmrA family transcriptional regulator n=1 Tax=Aquimarina algiphila TaxID=2047982 RepID=A0A554VC88_9FLAO|nr:NmrA family NAD(P)-binding protein [Aquimarina algiphila]TSE04246.1 NmrA family transcriptional regulator [Aquimarina algiphila]